MVKKIDRKRKFQAQVFSFCFYGTGDLYDYDRPSLDGFVLLVFWRQRKTRHWRFSNSSRMERMLAITRPKGFISFQILVEAESKRLPSLFVDDFAVLVILFDSMGAIVMRGRGADYSAGSIVRTGICPIGIGPGSGTVAICFEWHDAPSLT